MGTEHFHEEILSKSNHSNPQNELHQVQLKDPGINAEILNISNSNNQIGQEASSSSTVNISPFLVGRKEETRDESLIQSPFLVSNITSQISLNQAPALFNLEEIFMESDNYTPSKLQNKRKNIDYFINTLSHEALENKSRKNNRYNIKLVNKLASKPFLISGHTWRNFV